MNKHTHSLCLLLALVGSMAGASAQQIAGPGLGPNPQLPAPEKKGLLPTVNIAPALGWPEGVQPQAVDGFKVTALAAGLDHPRWVQVLPNGDVLVAESNKPEPAPGAKNVHADGLRGKAMGMVMKRAGAGTPSANRITLLRDADGDGVAETRTIFLQNLVSPYGMALVGNQLYIANADAIVKVPYETGQTTISATPVKVTDLPAGANHHWTKNIIASADGSKLYATVGSNSNIGDNGMASEEGRAAIWEVDLATGSKRLFASGLRNPNGLGWEPESKALWTVVNDRDEQIRSLEEKHLHARDALEHYRSAVKEQRAEQAEWRCGSAAPARQPGRGAGGQQGQHGQQGEGRTWCASFQLRSPTASVCFRLSGR